MNYKIILFSIFSMIAKTALSNAEEPAHPKANLRVDVQVRQSDVTPKMQIHDASISCPTIDYGRNKPRSSAWLNYSGKGWCWTRALNLPAPVDAEGNAILWFSLHPPPQEVKINTESSVYPGVFIGFHERGGGTEYKPTIHTLNNWQIVSYIKKHWNDKGE